MKYVPFLILSFFLVGLSSTNGNTQSVYVNAADEAKMLNELSNRFKTLSSVSQIGTSAGGRALMAIEIGAGNRDKKPALLVMGGVDPEDLSGPASSVQFARFLLEQSASDSVKSVLEKFTIYIVPRVSPDPLEAYFRKPLSVRQGNDHSDDADRDGKQDEDGPSDLNGDGLVSMMRVMDPTGPWMLHEANPKLMRKADARKGEVGRYLLLREGKDEDGDKKVNEDGSGGINVNKNTTYNPVIYTSDGGRHPFEAAEARALADFIFERPNILATFTFSYVDNVSRPWKIKYPRTPGPNRFTADSTAHAQLTAWLRPHASYTGAESDGGDITSWAYWHAGRFSFGAPAWSFPADSVRRGGNSAGNSSGSTGAGSNAGASSSNHELQALKWYEANDPSGFTPWTPLKHPDYPGQTVEIGWFKPFALTNAPTAPLQAQAAKKATSLLFHLASGLPDLSVAAPRIENLGGRVYRVTLTATNQGRVPTHSEIGRLVKGHTAFLFKTKLAKGQKLLMGSPTTFINEPLKGGQSVTQTFLISGSGTAQFEIGNPATGMRTVSVNLN